jgi:hypothetical protein
LIETQLFAGICFKDFPFFNNVYQLFHLTRS